MLDILELEGHVSNFTKRIVNIFPTSELKFNRSLIYRPSKEINQKKKESWCTESEGLVCPRRTSIIESSGLAMSSISISTDPLRPVPDPPTARICFFSWTSSNRLITTTLTISSLKTTTPPLVIHPLVYSAYLYFFLELILCYSI